MAGKTRRKRVQGYTMRRKGQLIHVRGYFRRRKSRAHPRKGVWAKET